MSLRLQSNDWCGHHSFGNFASAHLRIFAFVATESDTHAPLVTRLPVLVLPLSSISLRAAHIPPTCSPTPSQSALQLAVSPLPLIFRPGSFLPVLHLIAH